MLFWACLVFPENFLDTFSNWSWGDGSAQTRFTAPTTPRETSGEVTNDGEPKKKKEPGAWG